MFEGSDTHFFAGFLFVTHIDMRRRVVPDLDNGQSGRQSPTALKPIHFLFDALLNFFGDSLAVDDGGHESTPRIFANYIEKKPTVKSLTEIFG